MPKKIPVIFNHSAAIDDFVSQAMLMTMPNVDLKGIVVTNADCIATPAMDVSSRVHQFFGLDQKGVPLTLSSARGFNAFPWEYRADCINMGTIEILNPYKSKVLPPYDSGEKMVISILKKAIKEDNPVTYLVTGPVTTLSNIIEDSPKLAAGIKQIIWMGGAIKVPGNLDPSTIPALIANKYAEWNAFFDPFAVSTMFEHFKKVCVFPLDITDEAKITDKFRAALAIQAKKWSYSNFVHQSYQLVKDEPFYEMWNTCTTCYLGSAAPEIYDAPENMRLTIEKWGNDTQGWIREAAKGHVQKAFLNMKNPDAFYEYVLKQLQRD